MQRMWVPISAGRALKEGQCALERQAQYVNIRFSVQGRGVNLGRKKFY